MEESPKITKDMTLELITTTYPQTVPIIMEYGFHCIGCSLSTFETLEQGAMTHGLDEVELQHLLADLNDVVTE